MNSVEPGINSDFPGLSRGKSGWLGSMNVTVVTDKMTILVCRVEAKPMPTFNWITPAGLTSFNVQSCTVDPTNNLTFISHLEFSRAALSGDAGQYSCTGNNVADNFSQDATLTVLGETFLFHTSWSYSFERVASNNPSRLT